MKKKSKIILSIVLVGAMALTVGCGVKQVKTDSAPFTPQRFDASMYNAKVDNFMVILDASSSMAPEYQGERKFFIAKNVVERLNMTLPELGYSGYLRSYGPEAGFSETSLLYGPTAYSTANFADALNGAAGPAGNSPLGRAIEAADADLSESMGAGGNTAVIIVSDGKEPIENPVPAVQNFKQNHPGACFYTVLVGDNEGGRAMLEGIAEAGQCGNATTAENIYSSAGMAGFVSSIFLSEKPKPMAPPPKKVKPAPKPCPDADRDGVCDDRDRCPGTPMGAKVDKFGCWVLGQVLFDFDKAVIKPKAYPLLNEVAQILLKNPDLNVVFGGHTDSIGAERYNQRLSERRANAVMNYMISKGVPKEQMNAGGYGENRPVATNKTKEGRALNRRVEITPKKDLR